MPGSYPPLSTISDVTVTLLSLAPSMTGSFNTGGILSSVVNFCGSLFTIVLPL